MKLKNIYLSVFLSICLLLHSYGADGENKDDKNATLSSQLSHSALNSLNDMPGDVAFIIMQFLPAHALVSIAPTCTHWLDLVKRYSLQSHTLIYFNRFEFKGGGLEFKEDQSTSIGHSHQSLYVFTLESPPYIAPNVLKREGKAKQKSILTLINGDDLKQTSHTLEERITFDGTRTWSSSPLFCSLPQGILIKNSLAHLRYFDEVPQLLVLDFDKKFSNDELEEWNRRIAVYKANPSQNIFSITDMVCNERSDILFYYSNTNPANLSGSVIYCHKKGGQAVFLQCPNLVNLLPYGEKFLGGLCKKCG